MSDLFENNSSAKMERDRALAIVRANGGDWHAKATVALTLIDNGWTGTAEDIRIRLVMKGLEKPHHHNAWGAWVRAMVTAKRLVPTGEFRHMKTNKSHARRTSVYRVRHAQP